MWKDGNSAGSPVIDKCDIRSGKLICAEIAKKESLHREHVGILRLEIQGANQEMLNLPGKWELRSAHV